MGADRNFTSAERPTKHQGAWEGTGATRPLIGACTAPITPCRVHGDGIEKAIVSLVFAGK